MDHTQNIADMKELIAKLQEALREKDPCWCDLERSSTFMCLGMECCTDCGGYISD